MGITFSSSKVVVMNRNKQHEEVSSPSVIPSKVKASLEAEMAKLGDSFPRCSNTVADLVAEANEMLAGRLDVDDLIQRQFSVTTASFDRIEGFLEIIKPLEIEQSIALESRKAQTRLDDEARATLLDIRSRFARLADAAELSPELFMIDTSSQDELYRGMGEVIGIVRAHRSVLPDRVKVDELVRQAESVMAAGAHARAQAALLTDARRVATLKIDQAKRLLFDTMRHISKQGLAAYPDDVTRERIYRLERLNAAKRPIKKSEDPGPPSTPGVAA